MTTETIAPSDASATGVSASDERWLRRLVLIAAMVALADWLFFRHGVGISLVLFVIALEAAVLIASPARPDRRDMLTAVAVLAAALLPMVEAPTLIAYAFCLAGAAYFAVVGSARAVGGWREKAAASVWLVVAEPFQVVPDVADAYHAARRGRLISSAANVLIVWTVPLVLGAIFLGLFASANPVIERWLAELRLLDSMTRFEGLRVLFWLAAIVLVWPFICMTRRGLEDARVMAGGLDHRDFTVPLRLFGDAAIVRSLILFNLLFAAQTAMDIYYLWGGAELPSGMTYASYAHRGAYPLIITALLAAGFVIVAMRPGSAAERSPLMRALVLLWTGQNLLLVVSSILRLNLYVAAYSLTYLRVAAFVWMLLVAIGLVLIVVRIMLYLSSTWLVAANAAALTLVIYVCAFINFPYVIASYNVTHSREVSGEGVSLDMAYLIELGPQALPALDDYIARGAHPAARRPVAARRDNLAVLYLDAKRDWRGWNFRAWRVKRYLEGRAPVPTANTSPSS